MASPIDIATIINSISTCADEAEQAESNKAICKEIADELLVIHKILSNLDHEGKEKVEKHKLDFILKKIHKIVCRSRVLFDKCRSGKILVRIRNFLGAASIKEELEKLKNEALISIAVLCLVLKIKTEKGSTESGSRLPNVDESVFDQIEEDIGNFEDYYTDAEENESH